MILFPMLAGSLFTEYRLKRINPRNSRVAESNEELSV